MGIKDMGVVGDRGLEPPTSTAAGAPGLPALICFAPEDRKARGSTSAVLARGYKARASGEPKARPLTVCRKPLTDFGHNLGTN